ncbi:MAG: CoA ester lyase [Caldilineaceae bacterium]|nr:CoA ester lyase [Caldilineaceae bacterium]
MRSMLFTPGDRPDMAAKAAAGQADAVCLDLEDAVAPGDKEAARAAVIQTLRGTDFGARTRLVRINALDTPFAYRDLVDVVENAGDQIDLIMLPKASSGEDVRFVATLLSQIEARQGINRAIGLEAQIESAAGLVNLREIGAASPRLEALIFGPGDFAASMQMPSAGIGEFDAYDDLYPGHRWHTVMQMLAATARTNGLRAVDGPYAAFRDDEGLTRSARIAHALGFDGKQCIHPGQLATVNGIFSPREDEVARAERIVAAYQEAQDAGRGAISLDGKMIDAANLRMAQVILARHEQVQARRG